MSTRPGGLTALAVLNFIFGGISALAMLAAGAVIGVAEKGAPAGAMEEALANAGTSTSLLYISLFLGLISAGLLIASGVGYLGLKKFLGQKLGIVYAGVSIGASVLTIVLGQGFGISTIIGLVYPILTAILLMTTFKDDFVN